MQPIPILTLEDVNQIDKILSDFLQKSESNLAVVIDRGGNIISQQGDMEIIDVTTVAALAAGSFAATMELAKRIGEVEFNALYHQGKGMHIFINSVDTETIMVTVFNDKTTIGLVRFYTTNASQLLHDLLQSLREKPHEEFTLTQEDISEAISQAKINI
ncbi:MAG: roadblock/LC7 domain-containing protein [Verrucomicrobiae bacterium]|nr:roadblock/LC7 domain-containing protein [Verrucomicrobiae bacterium]